MILFSFFYLFIYKIFIYLSRFSSRGSSSKGSPSLLLWLLDWELYFLLAVVQKLPSTPRSHTQFLATFPSMATDFLIAISGRDNVTMYTSHLCPIFSIFSRLEGSHRFCPYSRGRHYTSVWTQGGGREHGVSLGICTVCQRLLYVPQCLSFFPPRK